MPGSGRSPGGGHGNLLQPSCLENPMDTGAWWATIHGVTKSQTQLSTETHHSTQALCSPKGTNWTTCSLAKNLLVCQCQVLLQIFLSVSASELVEKFQILNLSHNFKEYL